MTNDPLDLVGQEPGVMAEITNQGVAEDQDPVREVITGDAVSGVKAVGMVLLTAIRNDHGHLVQLTTEFLWDPVNRGLDHRRELLIAYLAGLAVHEGHSGRERSGAESLEGEWATCLLLRNRNTTASGLLRRTMPQSLRADSNYLVAVLVTLAFFFGVVEAAKPAARTLPPPKGKIFQGVTDTGEAEHFWDFARAVGRKPAVIHTFHPWGNSFRQALPRWRKTKARPMLHITTRTDAGAEIITPLQIANGKGDDYLLRLNRAFHNSRTPAYLRPMGEPNRCKNLYAGVDCSGSVRGGSYSFEYYRAAFRRIATIVRGGGKRGKINAKLRKIGLPKIQKVRGVKKLPRRIPGAAVSMVWSPLPDGAPGVYANRPKSYWPGSRWVDWVGTTFDSRYSNWKHLKRFYQTWAEGKDKPMVLAEWWLGGDDPRFVKRLFAFMKRHSKAKMMVFYQDFGSSNSFRIQNFPRARRAYSKMVDTPRFPRYAPRYPRPRMEPPDGGLTPG